MRSARPAPSAGEYDGFVTTGRQYAPPVRPQHGRGDKRILQHLPAEAVSHALTPRNDLVLECEVAPGEFTQAHGPFVHYRRRVSADGTQSIEYRLQLPWFSWVFGPLVRMSLRRRPAPGHPEGKQPWWAPGDRLDERQVLVLGLLAAASMCCTFTNTLFTQTAHKVSDAFDVGGTGQGIAGAIVRVGIVFALPFAFRADRFGRRRVIRWLAVAAPIVCALGALAPNFPILVATQTIGRPLGLALDLLIAVVAAEEVPRNSRAYAASVMAMSGGLGGGVCVWLLPLTGVADWGWRIPFAASLIWLTVAVSLRRHLPETIRFQTTHARAPRLRTPRLGAMATIAFFSNLFVAPASFFQNRYLEEVRGYTNFGVTLFTILTATPAAIGLLVGGALADRYGRRIIGVAALVFGTLLINSSFAVSGSPMWGAAILGSICVGAAVPAIIVYRTELFPTASRGRAGGIITASSLLGGSIGLVAMGQLVDRDFGYAPALGVLALGQIAVAAIVLTRLPESAHRELEELNPEDRSAQQGTGEPTPGAEPVG